MSDAGVIAIRWALYVDLGLLFGLPLFALYGLGGNRTDHRPLPIAAMIASLALLGLLLSVLGFGIQISAMADLPLAQPDWTLVRDIFDGTPLGTALKVRLAALLVLLLCAACHRRSPRASVALATLAGACALSTLAWSGHGAAGEGSAGWLQLAADLVHLLAAGAWLGAIAAFILLAAGKAAPDDMARVALADRALRRFGRIGSLLVGLIIASGAVNGAFLVGLQQVASLGQSTYGRLLIAKLLLFVSMLGLAALNRYRLTPRLESALEQRNVRGAMGALRRSLLAEIGFAIAILGLVAWLGTLSPPMSE